MENNSFTGIKKPKDNLSSHLNYLSPDKLKSLTKKIDRIIVDNTINQIELKKLNQIEDLPTEILKSKPFKYFHSCHLLIQEKGSGHATILSSQQDLNQEDKKWITSIDFNRLFNQIKKSKNKNFQIDLKSKEILSLVGTYIAKEKTFKTANIIIIVSREDFLPSSDDELNQLEELISSLAVKLEKLINLFLCNENNRYLYLMIENFPFPVSLFQNDTKLIATSFDNEKPYEIEKVSHFPQGYKLISYANESEEISSEIFHHQRLNLLGELLNTLRHELNNPLFGMKLTSESLRPDLNQEQNASMDEILKSIKRCQEIIDNFSNIYTNTDQIQNFSLKKIIDESLVLSKSETKQIKVSQYYSGNLTPNTQIDSNLTSLIQILFNLLVNSAQAMRMAQVKNPSVQITFSKSSRNIEIDLEDNGTGIPKSLQEKIFTPFFTTKPQGTGLGLVIAKKLCRDLKGDLYYLPNSTLGGAHFKISIPIENL